MILAEIDFGQGVEDAWSSVATFVPRFLAFLAILLIGYFIAKAIAKITDRALERVGFDRAVERGGVGQMLARSKYDPSDFLSKVVLYGLMLIVLQMAFGVFGQNPVSDLIEGIIAYLPKVIAAVIIVVVAAAVAAVVRDLVAAALSSVDYGTTLAKAAGVAILVIGAFAALDQLQIAEDIVNILFTGLVVAIVGVAIVAVGGSGIRALQPRWETALDRWDQEKTKVRASTSSTETSRIAGDAGEGPAAPR